MSGIQLTISISAFVGVIFACGRLFQKVNNHEGRLKLGDEKLEAHGEAVARMKEGIETLKEDTREIRKDVKQILRNNKK